MRTDASGRRARAAPRAEASHRGVPRLHASRGAGRSPSGAISIHGGRSIARFTRKHDPTSLRFVAGYEPDFEAGILEVASSQSRLYGGEVERFRILSRNRKIQYLFLASPRHAWIVPPQATTTELSSYGVRTIDVVADEDLFVPGYEYHYVDTDEDPPVLVSQIPAGFVGADERARRHARRCLGVARSRARHRGVQAPGRRAARLLDGQRGRGVLVCTTRPSVTP